MISDTAGPERDIALELALAPEDVALLLRQPELRAETTPGARRRSARATRCRRIWHDTADGDLAGLGQSLCHQTAGGETVWLLERLVPGPGEIAPPGAVPALIRATALPTDLPHDLPRGPLLPIAAFEGQERRFEVGGVQIHLLQGELRAVTAVAPVCRVRLVGPGSLSLAAAWCVKIRLSCPRISLAAEALALAGRPGPDRLLGAPSLSAEMDAQTGFAFVVAHLAGVLQHHALAAGHGSDPGGGPEPVHQMRVGLRRLRSAMLLFRRAVGCPAIDDVTLGLKALGQALGPPRDWDVFTRGTGRDVERALPDEPAIVRLMTAAERQRQAAYAELRRTLESPAWRSLGVALAGLALERPWTDAPQPDPDRALRQAERQAAPLPDFAGRAIQQRLEVLVAPGPDLSGLPMEALHEIRLHAKRLRYAAEFFAPLFPGRQTRRFLRRLSSLQEHLGLMNDGAVAAGLMARLEGATTRHRFAAGAVRGFVAARAAGGRRRMERDWARLLRQDAFWS